MYAATSDTSTTTTTPAVRSAPPAQSLHIRPLRAGEEHLVQEVFRGLSARSRFLRFHAPTPRLTAGMLRSLAQPGDRGRGTLLALVGADAVGHGQWVRDARRPRRAEISLSVVDRHHRRGIGRSLAQSLAAAAAPWGVTEFIAWVHPENHLLAEWLRRLGSVRLPEEPGAVVVPLAALDGPGCVGSPRAHRHLERQLAPLPHRPGRGVRPTP